MQFLTIKEVAQKLNIGVSTIYHNGPSKYGGVKFGGSWRFPENKIGVPFEPEKKASTGYIRRFGNKKKAR